MVECVVADIRFERRHSHCPMVTPAEDLPERTKKQTNMKTRAHSFHIDERDGGSVFIHL